MNSQKICISKKNTILVFIFVLILGFVVGMNKLNGSQRTYNSRASAPSNVMIDQQIEKNNGESAAIKKPVTSGVINVYNIIVDFKNNPNPETVDTIQNKFKTVDSYYNLTTNGKLHIQSKTVKTPSLDEYSIKGTQTNCRDLSHVKKWMTNLKKDTYDKDPQKDTFNVITFTFPVTVGQACQPGYITDLTTPFFTDHVYISGSQGFMAYAHEIGHYTGLGHADFLYCKTKSFPQQLSDCTVNYSDDPYNIMARFNPGQFNGLMKSRNGWLNSNIYEAFYQWWRPQYNQDITLSALEFSTTNTQLVKIPKSDTLFGDAYYVEYRYPALYDDQIPLPSTGAVFIYMNNLDPGAAQDTLLLSAHPSNTQYGYDTLKNAPMVTGDSFDDTKNKIKITVISIDPVAKTAKINVSRY